MYNEKDTVNPFIAAFLLSGCVSYNPRDFHSAYDYLHAVLAPTLFGLDVPITGTQDVFLFRNGTYQTSAILTRHTHAYLESDIRFVAFSDATYTDQLTRPFLEAKHYCAVHQGNWRRLETLSGYFYFAPPNVWVLYKNAEEYLREDQFGNLSVPKTIEQALDVPREYFGRYECDSKDEHWTVRIYPVAFWVDNPTDLFPTNETGMVVKVSAGKPMPHGLQ